MKVKKQKIKIIKKNYGRIINLRELKNKIAHAAVSRCGIVGASDVDRRLSEHAVTNCCFTVPAA